MSQYRRELNDLSDSLEPMSWKDALISGTAVAFITFVLFMGMIFLPC